MKGILYGIGTGPGDGELMTLKAVRLIKESDIIAVAASSAESSISYKTALSVVPEMKNKRVLLLRAPMTGDRARIMSIHTENARRIESHLDRGENVAFLTLGDPSIYSTFGYIRDALKADGYETRAASGVASFSEAAARLGITLASWDEPVFIIPAGRAYKLSFDKKGAYVLMKPQKNIGIVKAALKKSGRSVAAVMNCGMDGETIWLDIDDIPDDAGYFTVIIVK
ncbi:MAG: precorrin-2 C(20)-methyltransferase [Clostridia bacterium]|nr:precorrin-2 C(20)-methyltransferase [Clostridia bacterium]